MDRMGSKEQPVMKKVKKKQVKDELDRQKQAEKKKRRLEKALATSAAIISELEKKKLKKKEEQQRLEEEGAAIAEAVALHVLLEDETNDSCKFALNKGGIFKVLDQPRNFDLFLGKERSNLTYQESRRCFQEHIGYSRNDYRSFSSGHHGVYGKSFPDETGWGFPGISAGVIAAQAVSSLQIAEYEHKDQVALHGML